MVAELNLEEMHGNDRLYSAPDRSQLIYAALQCHEFLCIVY